MLNKYNRFDRGYKMELNELSRYLNNIVKSSKTLFLVKLELEKRIDILLKQKDGISLIQLLETASIKLLRATEEGIVHNNFKVPRDLIDILEQLNQNRNSNKEQEYRSYHNDLDLAFSLCYNYPSVLGNTSNYQLLFSFLSKSISNRVKYFYRCEIINLYTSIYKMLSSRGITSIRVNSEYKHDLMIARKYYLIVNRYAKTKHKKIEVTKCINTHIFGCRPKSYIKFA